MFIYLGSVLPPLSNIPPLLSTYLYSVYFNITLAGTSELYRWFKFVLEIFSEFRLVFPGIESSSDACVSYICIPFNFAICFLEINL
jgi:hypothetical protein